MIDYGLIKRGDIFVYDWGRDEGSVQTGKRPVMVVQNHKGSRNSPTTIVAAISSSIKKMNLPAHVWLGAGYGLKLDSIVMLEQLRTVNKADLGKHIGTVDDEHILKRIEQGLKKQLGLNRYRTADAKNIRCLCARCVADYRMYDTYVVRRADPYNTIKDECIKCGRPGYDYFVSKKE